MKKRYFILILIIVFGGLFFVLFRDASAPEITIPSTDTVLDPEIPPAQKDDMIIVDTPRPKSVVSADAIVIKGKARGSWYFEGSFPVTLIDTSGTVLLNTYAKAQAQWMTNEYVPFSTVLNYPRSVHTPMQAIVVLKKDNPSGESRFDAELRIPVTIQ